jgi:hypothetical protein
MGVDLIHSLPGASFALEKFPERINIDQVFRGVEPMLLVTLQRRSLWAATSQKYPARFVKNP